MMRYGEYINPLKNLWRQKLISGNRNFLQSIMQASLLRHRLDAFPHMCRPEIVTLVNQYADLGSISSKIERIQKFRAAGIRSQVWFRQLLLYYRILFSLN
jgi:hypothetical protein